MPSGAKHQDAAAREHRRRFRIENQRAVRAMAFALAALEANEQALQLALDRIGSKTPTSDAVNVRTALRLLVEGPSGEFR